MNKILIIAGAVLAMTVLFSSSFVSSAEAKGKPVVDKTTGIKLSECSIIATELNCSFFTKDGIGIWIISPPNSGDSIILLEECVKKDSRNLGTVSDGLWSITIGECSLEEMSTFDIEISGGQISSITVQ